MGPNIQPQPPSQPQPAPPPSHWAEEDIDEAIAESFPASDPPAYSMGVEPAPPPEPPGGKTRPPDAPLDPVLSESFEDTQPEGFKDHPRSAIEAADEDVEDTIGGE